MIGLICFVVSVLASPFKSKMRLEAENAVLRHQLVVLRCKQRGRVPLTNNDRWFFIQLYRWFPSILQVLTIIRPETLVGWHRAGFRRYWQWKSRRLGGRPQIEIELRVLIRRMSVENPLWGAPDVTIALIGAASCLTLIMSKYLTKSATGEDVRHRIYLASKMLPPLAHTTAAPWLGTRPSLKAYHRQIVGKARPSNSGKYHRASVIAKRKPWRSADNESRT
jgi:hypothetical protein